MRNPREVFSAHWLAILLALTVSVIVASPQLFFRFEHRADGLYQGIELLPDSPWSARVREVQDGHPNFGSIYYKDGKDNPYLFQPLGSMIVAYTGQALSLDINDTILLFRLLWPFVVFILIYAFVYALSGRKLVALSAAALLLLAESALSLFGVREILGGMSPEDFLRIGRPVNPAMIYVFFFGFLIAFWKFYKNYDWRWGAVSAVLLGLNFYNYFYTWTYLFAFGGVLGLLLLVQKKWKEGFSIAAVFIAALVLAIPYGINLYNVTGHPAYLEAGLRNGIIFTHEPLFVGFTVLLALAAFLFFYPREDKRNFLFGLALLLTPFVTLNQQILTGRVLQEAHYHWFFHKPIAVIFLLIIVFLLLERFTRPSYQKVLAGLVIAGSFAIGAFVQADSYLYPHREGGSIAIERQKYGPVMDWLNENAEKEEVVFANDEASHMTVIYTPQNVFYHRAGVYSLASTDERLRTIIFSFYRLRGVGTAEAREVFFSERKFISSNLYGEKYRQELGSYQAIPDDKVEEFIVFYQEALKTPTPEWLRETFTKYEVAYAVWDKKKDPLWRLDQFDFFKKAAVFGDIAVYQFLP